MKFNFDKTNLLTGTTFNSETGYEDLYGVDPYRNLGYFSGGCKSIDATSYESVSATISWVVQDHNEVNTQNSLAWLVGTNKVYRYNIDTQAISSTATGAAYGPGGAAQMKNVLYIGGDLTVDKIGKLSLGSGALGAFTAAHFSTKATHFKEMQRFKDVIYGCNKDSIFSITDSATFSGSALVLESNTTAVSLAPYGEFLAIGAFRGRYYPASEAAATIQGMYRSKLYFWDPTATPSLWDTNRSTEINGRILKVLNKKGILYVFIKDRNDSFSINYFDGNAIQPIQRVTLKEGATILAPQKDAYDVKGDLIYFGVTETSTTGGNYTIGRVMSYGKGYAGLDNALFTPHIHPMIASRPVTQINTLKWVKDDTLLMSISDTASNHSLKLFKPSNGYFYYNIKTPTMYTGNKQICTKIKLHFKPLATGDVVYMHRNIDNAGFESSIWDSCSYAANGAINQFVTTREFEFNNLQLRIAANPTAGDVKIKSIIVDTHDSDEL